MKVSFWVKIMLCAAGITAMAGSRPEPRKRWQQRRIELLTIGAVRQYGLLLTSDDSVARARAHPVAEEVIKEAAKSEPALRAAVLRAFVFAAAPVNKAGDAQRVWLAEAARIDPAAEGREAGFVDPLTRAAGMSAK